MHAIATGLALLVALAIIVIGALYLSRPTTAMRSFGLPLPPADPVTAWWLRLKGVRDVVSGLVLLAVMARGVPGAVGLVLLVEALIPVGDMLLVLGAKGSTRTALFVHGVTALLMIVGAIPLLAERS